MPDHFPWPPLNTTAVGKRYRQREVEWERGRAASRSGRNVDGGIGGGSGGGLRLGSPHSDFGAGAEAADLVDPLTFKLALNYTLTLLDYFASYGTPLKYINLDFDELMANTKKKGGGPPPCA